MSVAEDLEGWLTYRRKGIGGTDIGAILGLSPWNSPLSIFLGKTGQNPPPKPTTQAMEWGTFLEPKIAADFRRDTNTLDLLTGLDIATAFPGRASGWAGHTIVQHASYDYLLGTPDGFAPRSRRGLEIKTAGFKGDEWGVQGTDAIPEHYLVQCALVHGRHRRGRLGCRRSFPRQQHGAVRSAPRQGAGEGAGGSGAAILERLRAGKHPAAN